MYRSNNREMGSRLKLPQNTFVHLSTFQQFNEIDECIFIHQRIDDLNVIAYHNQDSYLNIKPINTDSMTTMLLLV